MNKRDILLHYMRKQLIICFTLILRRTPKVSSEKIACLWLFYLLDLSYKDLEIFRRHNLIITFTFNSHTSNIFLHRPDIPLAVRPKNHTVARKILSQKDHMAFEGTHGVSAVEVDTETELFGLPVICT